ncbi:hypothetical protein F4813DRAFT_114321 [Daldinia decipiens]|uniref:uncharacterized protein n=1 Tax=Daldinia decipiens TaxID=326647 RepID=UPI0020C298E3|nr:uncharacterized protein F4813DRAFT_114321 [Daldinia decipiens]KAI1656889.1 hypothetical protein F4813DRAFT_114321 [Daldinia decipiens]
MLDVCEQYLHCLLNMAAYANNLTPSLEAHIVLISASIPTARAIFKTRKSLGDSRSGNSNEMNTFMKWKRAMGGNSPHDGISGIRKETTVSTTFDSDPQLAYTQHHVLENDWEEI